MKKLFILFVMSGTFISHNLLSQTNKNSIEDSLIWHMYIGGKPDMKKLECRENVARRWGIVIEYFYGDCVGTYNYKAKEFEDKNKMVFEYLKQKFGGNWLEKFNKEVENEFEHSK